MTAKALALTLRLERLLGNALGKMTPAEKENAERGLESLRLQLRMRNGAPAGPSQQNGLPGSQNDQRNKTPGGPGTQPGSEQKQNQQTQPAFLHIDPHLDPVGVKKGRASDTILAEIQNSGPGLLHWAGQRTGPGSGGELEDDYVPILDDIFAPFEPEGPRLARREKAAR